MREAPERIYTLVPSAQTAALGYCNFSIAKAPKQRESEPSWRLMFPSSPLVFHFTSVRDDAVQLIGRASRVKDI